jgi:hypothetical protein
VILLLIVVAAAVNLAVSPLRVLLFLLPTGILSKEQVANVDRRGPRPDVVSDWAFRFFGGYACSEVFVVEWFAGKAGFKGSSIVEVTGV